jgi:hypothetical protein
MHNVIGDKQAVARAHKSLVIVAQGMRSHHPPVFARPCTRVLEYKTGWKTSEPPTPLKALEEFERNPSIKFEICTVNGCRLLIQA